MFKPLFETISQARIIAKEKRAKDIEAMEKRNIAKAFNDRYTYRVRLFKDREILPGIGMHGISIKGDMLGCAPNVIKYTNPLKLRCSLDYSIQNVVHTQKDIDLTKK